MKNYIKVFVFVVLATGLLFLVVNLYPSKSFAARLSSESNLEEDLPNTFDDDCLPGICDDEEDNPYLDLGDEENDNLRDDNLPDSNLPDSDLSGNDLPNDNLPIHELPRTREQPEIPVAPKIAVPKTPAPE